MAIGADYLDKIVAASVAVDRARAAEQKARAVREEAELALQAILQGIAALSPSPAATAPAAPVRLPSDWKAPTTRSFEPSRGPGAAPLPLRGIGAAPLPFSEEEDAPPAAATDVPVSGPAAGLSPAAFSMTLTVGAMRDRVLNFLNANAGKYFTAADIAPHIAVANLDSLRTTLATLVQENEIVRGEIKGQYTARPKKEVRL